MIFCFENYFENKHVQLLPKTIMKAVLPLNHTQYKHLLVSLSLKINVVVVVLEYTKINSRHSISYTSEHIWRKFNDWGGNKCNFTSLSYKCDIFNYPYISQPYIYSNNNHIFYHKILRFIRLRMRKTELSIRTSKHEQHKAVLKNSKIWPIKRG